MLIRFNTIPERDRQTDGQTESLYQYRNIAQQIIKRLSELT